MISFLRGKLFSVQPGYVDVDVSGVGYRVYIPSRWADQLMANEEFFAFTHQAVREDAILLYGFENEADKDWFELLLNVSGIGPKGALQLLSATTRDAFGAMVAEEDTAGLCNLPGIGKKTAQRLVVELKDRMDTLWYAETTVQTGRGAAVPKSALSPVEQDVVDALVGLGYAERPALEQVRQVLKDHGDLPLEEVLRYSLQGLSRPLAERA